MKRVSSSSIEAAGLLFLPAAEPYAPYRPSTPLFLEAIMACCEREKWHSSHRINNRRDAAPPCHVRLLIKVARLARQ